jgi:hypothetical protein
LIEAMESRGLDVSRMIEETGGKVAEDLLSKGTNLADTIIGSVNRIETSLSENAGTIETSLDSGTARLADLLSNHADGMVRSLSGATEILGETLHEKAGLVERHLDGGTARISGLFESHSRGLSSDLERMAGTIESTLRSQTEALEASLVERGLSLADLLSSRIAQTNEAFEIASESLGSLITDRTREASTGLRGEIEELGTTLMQHAASATEQLAHSGRDVVQAIATQGTRVNEALAANAMKLAETVTERTAGLSDKFEVFERVFVDKTDSLENAVTARSAAITETLQARTGEVTSTLESLLGRIETGLDNRAKTLGDTLALRTLEFSRIVGDSGAQLLGSLENKVESFSSKVVAPLAGHIAEIEARADGAATRITSALDQSGGAIMTRAESVERALTTLGQDISSGLGSKTDEAIARIAERLEQSSGAIVLRAGEVERSLTALSRDVGTELIAKADDLARRVTASLGELNAVIEAGTANSLGGMAEANDKLKNEVGDLLGRLNEANQSLSGIVGTATANLGDVERRMADRVRGLESTLAAILSASREGSDVLAAKVEAIRAASSDVLGHGETISRDLETRTTALQTLASELGSTQTQVNRLLAERQDAFESLTGTLQSRVEDVDSLLRSFTALVDDQLTSAQAKARETSALVHETAESAAAAIGTQFERVRIESGKERERTAASLRSAYEQANTEMSTLFQRSLEGFSATAGQFRQATQEVLRDLDTTRAALQSGGLEIPREASEAAANLKRVVTDQVRALTELSTIVAQSGPALDVAQPHRIEQEPPRAASAYRPAPETAPRFETRNPRPAAPASPTPRPPGTSWLSGLLERASGDEPQAQPRARQPESISASRIESLDSLSVDIARMIDHEAAVELWERYRKGERNVFTRRLYTIQGQEAYDDVRRRYRRDDEFRKTVDAYVDQFERLLGEVAGDDRDSMVARTYLTSETGKVYTMLAHAAGRFD